MKRICTIKGCNEFRHGKGLCTYHYNQEWNLKQGICVCFHCRETFRRGPVMASRHKRQFCSRRCYLELLRKTSNAKKLNLSLYERRVLTLRRQGKPYREVVKILIKEGLKTPNELVPTEAKVCQTFNALIGRRIQPVKLVRIKDPVKSFPQRMELVISEEANGAFLKINNRLEAIEKWITTQKEWNVLQRKR